MNNLIEQKHLLSVFINVSSFKDSPYSNPCKAVMSKFLPSLGSSGWYMRHALKSMTKNTVTGMILFQSSQLLM